MHKFNWNVIKLVDITCLNAESNINANVEDVFTYMGMRPLDILSASIINKKDENTDDDDGEKVISENNY